MEWDRGASLGTGTFASVHLAIPRVISAQFSSPAAVKSADVFASSSLRNEQDVFHRLGPCPQIVRCFGHDSTFENGVQYYNLFLEYAAGGSLADQLKICGGRLPESDVRRYTRSIVRGLRHIHASGFVHCDIKLPNILLFANGDVKIADFGLAKKSGPEQRSEETKYELRGTPACMSPESVNDNEYESPADIWALGCAVVEMVTGKPAWDFKDGSNIFSLLMRIGGGEELPEIPNDLSDDGKDFLRRCLVKDPRKRWTAEKLSEHPFVADETVSLEHVKEPWTSPRSHFDFPDWVSNTTTSALNSPESDDRCEWKFESSRLCSTCSPEDRLRELMTNQTPNWSASDNWICVR
ncbi:mitogen-activated protein kinase kinase kinase 17 [Neltuma alba]|uniref:mitogen-activated protein kinase kinase kinase 17 n=1 Tax=Neltuma alba TaxID=207710 RepID=UPI0010A3B27F|nr:mitogen-activated protein kinase kinase kinase 17 [Prosopis alba]